MHEQPVVWKPSCLDTPTISPVSQQVTELLVSAGNLPDTLNQIDTFFEKITFTLGEAIYPTPDSPSGAHLEDHFYLMGQGRVRLLCLDNVRQREVSFQILETGHWFGGDTVLLGQNIIPYRAVAATEVILYRLAATHFKPWLEQYPNLQTHLSKAVREYQRIAFFRTQSAFRRVPSQQIRALVSQICDRPVPAQTAMATYLQGEEGIYWVQSGRIQSAQTVPPQAGESFHSRDLAQQDWEAATNLHLLYLPTDRGSHSSDLNVLLNEVLPPADQRLPEVVAPYPKGGRGVATPYPATVTNAPPGPVAIAVPPPTAPERDSPSVIFPKPLRRQALDRLHRFPWIEQQSSSDCGAACLAMVAQYWGKRFPIHVLRERANVGREGASLKSLARGAESIGFHARPVRASLGRIAEHPNPWIAHWQGDHYIVVYQVDKHTVTLADPATGKRVISHREFNENWSGYALLIDPTDRFQDIEIKQASLGRYLRLLSPYRSLIFQVLIVSLLIQIFSLITPLFTQIILDTVVVQKSMSALNVFAIGLLMFSVWNIIMMTVRSYLLSYFSMRLDLTMISGFIKHAIALPLKFYESRRVGDIITRVQENEKIQRFLISRVLLAWLGVLTGFVYLVLMAYYNWQLTLMVLSLIPPIIFITLGATPFLRRISREVFKEAANQNSTLVEMINGIAAVKSAGVEQEVRWRWEDQLTQMKNVVFRGQKFAIGLEAANSTVNIMGSTALLWLGAAMVIQDQLTIGQFVAFNMMIGYVLSPVVELANLWDELQEIFISVDRLNDVFEAQPEEPLDQAMLVLPPIQGTITFDKVTFRYDEDADHNILENLSFQVAAGQTIAIVGRSGSGKTTLVKLLEGLYHPNHGRILIDGHDIRHVSPPSLRTQLGVVPQECFLFSGTILENITLYRYNCKLAQVIEAAKLAEAHAFIQELPLGYNTKVGERGSTLSGGQRQRIAIARALLGHPRILILDEATSSLDTESERRFQRNLSQISRDRTTFIIAHRLSTVRNADRILVLDRGVLIEQGTHSELLKMQGLYYTLTQQQLDI